MLGLWLCYKGLETHHEPGALAHDETYTRYFSSANLFAVESPSQGAASRTPSRPESPRRSFSGTFGVAEPEWKRKQREARERAEAAAAAGGS